MYCQIQRAVLVSTMVFALFPEIVVGAIVTSASPNVSFDFFAFAGNGFSPMPIAGQLDSNDVIVTGMSQGSMSFGDTQTSGDFARGSSSGGVTTGGTYAFDVSNQIGPANMALGVQPIGNDWSPGTFAFELSNGDVSDVTQVDIDFKIYIFNDQDRANSITWQDSLDNINYVGFGSSVISDTVADTNPEWVLAADEQLSVNFSPDSFGTGDSYFFRFLGDDDSGSGSRDEFAIDDVVFSVSFASGAPGPIVPEPTGLIIWACGAFLWRLWRQWLR